MKYTLAILCLVALSACAARQAKPPKVDTAPVGQSFDRINASVDDLDALAAEMERRGQ